MFAENGQTYWEMLETEKRDEFAFETGQRFLTRPVVARWMTARDTEGMQRRSVMQQDECRGFQQPKADIVFRFM